MLYRPPRAPRDHHGTATARPRVSARSYRNFEKGIDDRSSAGGRARTAARAWHTRPTTSHSPSRRAPQLRPCGSGGWAPSAGLRWQRLVWQHCLVLRLLELSLSSPASRQSPDLRLLTRYRVGTRLWSKGIASAPRLVGQYAAAARTVDVVQTPHSRRRPASPSRHPVATGTSTWVVLASPAVATASVTASAAAAARATAQAQVCR